MGKGASDKRRNPSLRPDGGEIDERVRDAQQQVRESAERYRAFIENSSEGIWRIELDEPIDIGLPADEQVRLAYERGYLAECNDAMARQYGFDSAEEIVGLRLSDLLIKDDPNNTTFLTSFVTSGYRLTDAESHERVPEGSDRYFLNNFVGIIENGRLLRAWGSQRDITASRSAEVARSRLAAIVESSDDAIIGLDLSGHVTSWNAAAEQMFGYSEPEMIGKDIRSLIPDDRSGEEDALLARVAAGERVQHLETIRRTSGGRMLDVSLTISPILDPSGTVIGVSKTARDISERRAAERIFDENRLMLAMAMQSGRMGVWERDFATGLVTWSEELEAIFGLAPGEFRGDEAHYYALVHEDDRETAWHEVEQAIIEHRPYTIEFRFHHADGTVRWMEGRGEAVYSASGEPVRLYGVGIDITNRKFADKRLRESEERFRLALSSGVMTVYEQDADLRYLWLYPMSRYSPETIGMSDEELAPGDDGERLTELKRRVIATGEPLREEVTAFISDKRHWYDLIVEPRFDASGGVIGVGGAALDITARKNAEEQLKREALLLEAALEPVIVWELDGPIIDWNRGAERLYGFSAKEAIGRDSHELLQTDFPTAFDEIRRSLVRTGNWVGELRHTTRNGEELIVESRHQLIEFEGRLLVLETNRDITERKRVSEELRRSEARLQAMFDSTTVGFAVLDTSARFVQINDAFCQLTGYSRDELLDMDSGILTYPDDIPSIDTGLQRLIAGEVTHLTVENRYIRKDRSIVWVQNSISLTHDPLGRPLHLIAITQDVTDRKAAEDQLLLVSRVPAENPNPVLRLTPTGEVLYSNDAAAPMLEFWKRRGQTVPADLLARVKASFLAGNKKEIDLTYDGRTVSCTLAPIVDAGYVNIYGTDITSRKMAVEALRESEQRFSRFMQQLPGLAWIKDTEGRYVYANDAAERSFGTSKAELYGKVDEEVFPPDFAKQFREHDRRAMDSGTGIQVLESLVEDDGVTHYSIVSKFPISGPDGKPALIGGMAIDVTEQKQAEEALRRRMEFDEAVMTNMGEGLYTIDSQGLVTSMNPAAEKLFGWKLDELRGRRMHDVTHYKYRDGTPFPTDKCAGLAVLQQGVSLVNHEDVFIRKDGTFFDVLFSSSPIRENGKTTGLVIVFQDISEKKQVRESLERYRHVAEYATDIILLMRETGDIVEVNQAALAAYGYTRDEIIGMNIRTVRDPSTLTSLGEQLHEANSGNTYFETIHLRKDGTSFPVEVNASSAEFGGERLILSILRDITDRKRQERNHEFLFQLSDLIRLAGHQNVVFDSAVLRLGQHLELGRCFISTIDLEAETSTVTSEYLKDGLRPLVPTVTFSEYSTANLEAAQAGRTIVVLDVASDRRTAGKLSEGYSRDRIGSYVAAPLMRDGRWAAMFCATSEHAREWAEWEVGLIETVAERVWLAAEKLRSEAALRESERRAIEQYQSLLERIVPLAETLGAARELIGIYRVLHEFICVSMQCSGFFVSFYDARSHLRLPAYIWGEGEEIDIASLPPMPLGPDGGPNSQAVFSKQTIITNGYWEQQKNRAHLVLRENGIDPMSSIVVPMVVQDRVIGTLEVQAHQNEAFDREHAVALEMAANLAAVAIENVRLIEDEARARSEAESANRMKDEFLSVLSHELRTPLNAMLGWVRILRSGNIDHERLEKALEIIERNTRQQSSLIEDLLDVSRIISGKMRIEGELIDLVQALEQAAEIVRPLAVAKAVEFEVQAASEPLYLQGDVLRLQQVITNLLQNAVKFTPSGGKVALKFVIDGGEAVVSVTDTGVGIDPEFLPHIFDRFSQADASTRRTNTGLGLGLTIVRTIVELHGGTTTAESQGEGKGASFTVRLPLANELYATETSVPPMTTNGSTGSLSGVKILVVDDDADGLTPLRIMLEREAAIVATAGSASDALRHLRAKDFDILISDIGMPTMDGFELISQLRRNKRQRNHDIKAIAYTAYASEEDRVRVLSAGYEVHLAKPLDFDELLSVVKKFGDSVRSRSEKN